MGKRRKAQGRAGTAEIKDCYDKNPVGNIKTSNEGRNDEETGRKERRK